MNYELMKKAGFGRAIEDVKDGKCPFCHEQIDLLSFKDKLSKTEYEISGLCQKCQDKMFDA